MKGLLVLSAVISVSVAASPAQLQPARAQNALEIARARGEWRVYSSREGRFEVQMPGSPRSETEAVEFLSLHVSRLQTSSDRYLVAYSDYPREITEGANPDSILESVREGFLSRINGTTVARRTLNANGYPGQEVRYRLASGGEGIARFYLAGERLYQVVVSTPAPSNEFGDRAERFLSSFQMQ